MCFFMVVCYGTLGDGIMIVIYGWVLRILMLCDFVYMIIFEMCMVVIFIIDFVIVFECGYF